jgi:hypothetical protein
LLVKTAAIELTRRNPESVCIALHPGTVDTALSRPFAKTGLKLRPAEAAAGDLFARARRRDGKRHGWPDRLPG